MTPNDGFLDFSWNFDQLSAHVRALSFRPFENDFVHPKIRVGDEVLVISEIEKGNSDEGGLTGEVGEVLEINDSGISVRAADAVVHVSGLMDQALNEISVDNAVGLFNLGPGTILNDHGR
jgi:methionyl-tRNA formyltransferase